MLDTGENENENENLLNSHQTAHHDKKPLKFNTWRFKANVAGGGGGGKRGERLKWTFPYQKTTTQRKKFLKTFFLLPHRIFFIQKNDDLFSLVVVVVCRKKIDREWKNKEKYFNLESSLDEKQSIELNRFATPQRMSYEMAMWRWRKASGKRENKDFAI